MVKISVIIPVYNGEKYIKGCLKNLQKQTLKEFEVIVVNDGSRDKSGQVCDELSKEDKRIKVIHQNNYGVSNARNIGINRALGEYICFIDCDDYIDSDYLKVLYDECVNNNVKMSICGIQSVKEDGTLISIKEMKGGIYSSTKALKELFEFKNLNGGPCGKLIHKSLFKNDLYFPELKVYEDLIFSYKAIYKADNILFTNKCKYNYLHRDGVGTMANFIREPSTDIIKAAYDALAFIKLKVPSIWDTSFYGLISQVIMYISDIRQIDNKWKKKSSILYMNETKKLLATYRKELILNKSINNNEKIMFILLSYSCKIYKFITNIKKFKYKLGGKYE